MPLTECRACHGRVSADAVACPNCGEPIRGRRTEQATGVHAFLVILAVLSFIPLAWLGNHLVSLGWPMAIGYGAPGSVFIVLVVGVLRMSGRPRRAN